jgi:peptidoglycan biosynthesis protein MviN/MurJ (putative lipid II flippase)
LLLLVILIGVFQSGGILYVALAVSVVNIAGYVFILTYLKGMIGLHLKENFLLPLMIGTAVALLVALVIDPQISRWLPEAITLEAAAGRLVIIGLLIIVSSTLTEYAIRPTLYRERLMEVAAKFRK